MLQIKDIINKEIPHDNYHCWIYPQNFLNLIEYNINFTITNNKIITLINNNIIPINWY